MEGWIAGLELQPRVCLADIPRRGQPLSGHSVTVALEADFIEKLRIGGLAARSSHTADIQIRTLDRLAKGSANRADPIGVGRVWIVAIHAFHVASHGERDFGRVVDCVSKGPVVRRVLSDIRSDVESGNCPPMAVQAVVLLPPCP